MTVGLSVDKNGMILVAYNPESLKSANSTTAYVPQAGENHFTADLPTELEGKALSDIAGSYRVNLSGGKPVFQPLQASR